MKKLTFVMFITSTLIWSCSDEELSKSEQLIGIWNLATIDTAIYVNNEDVTDLFLSNIEFILDSASESDFNTDSILQITNIPLPSGGRIDILDNGVYKINFSQIVISNGHWELHSNNSKLKLFAQDNSSFTNFNVNTVNDMKLNIAYSEPLDFGEYQQLVLLTLGYFQGEISIRLILDFDRQIDDP